MLSCLLPGCDDEGKESAGGCGQGGAAPTVLSIGGTNLPVAVRYTGYTATLTASGAAGPFTWSIIAGALPAGLSLDPQSGVIAGNTQAVAGPYAFTVEATNSAVPAQGSASVVLQLNESLGASASGNQLTYREFDVFVQITPSGGSGAGYSWSLVYGALPPGISLTSTATGQCEISGIVSASAAINTYYYGAQVTDSFGAIWTHYDWLNVGVGVDALFILDRSAGTAIVDPGQTISRLDRGRNEVINALQTGALTGLYFDIITIGGAAPGTHQLFSGITPCSQTNLATAMAFLQALTPVGDSSSYSALSAIQAYPSNLDEMYFIYGTLPGPDPGAPGGQASHGQILVNAPSWFSVFVNVDFYSVNCGDAGAHASFMQDIAALLGGSYLII